MDSAQVSPPAAPAPAALADGEGLPYGAALSVVALAAAIAVLLWLTWTRVTSTTGVLGADTANYLLTMRRVFGEDPTGLGLQRPPLIAFPLKLATSVLPLVAATKALALLAWAAGAVPAYFLIRTLVGPGGRSGVFALAGAVGYLLTTMFAGMLVWGWITFAVLALIALIALLITDAPARGGWRRSLLLGLVFALLVGTHQIGTLVVALWLALSVPLLVVLRDRAALWLLVRSAAIVALLSAWLIPLYLALANRPGEETAALGIRPWAELLSQASFFFRDPHPWFWILLLALAAVGVVAAAAPRAGRHRRRGALLMVALVVAPLLPFASNEVLAGRMLYFTVLPVWVLAAVGAAAAERLASNMLSRTRTGAGFVTSTLRPAVVVALVALMVVLFGRFETRLAGAIGFYGFLDERHVEAAAYVAAASPESR